MIYHLKKLLRWMFDDEEWGYLRTLTPFQLLGLAFFSLIFLPATNIYVYPCVVLLYGISIFCLIKFKIKELALFIALILNAGAFGLIVWGISW